MGFLVRAVLTLDVVNFSQIKPDQKQLEVIQALIQMLRQAIPKEHNKKKDAHPFELRMGIHLGTVTKETDFDDRVNVWGEGVNISARVTGLAKPGQILVSEDFYKAAALQTWTEGEVASIGKWWAKHHQPMILYNIYTSGVGLPPSDIEEWYGPFHYPLSQAINTYEAMIGEQKSTGPAFRVAVLAKRLLDLQPKHRQAEEVLKSLSREYSRFAKIPLYHGFFSELSPSALVHFFRNAEFRDFKKGEVIVHEGDPADSLMMVVSGEVSLEIEGQKIFLSEGGIVGEMGLFNPGGKRNTTLTASKNTITLTLDYRFLRVPDEALDSPGSENQLEIQKQIWKSYCERTTENKINSYHLFRALPDYERNKLIHDSKFLPTKPGQAIPLTAEEAWNYWILIAAGKITVRSGEAIAIDYDPEDCLGPIRLFVKVYPFSKMEFLPGTQLICLSAGTLDDLARTLPDFRSHCLVAGDTDRNRFGLA